MRTSVKLTLVQTIWRMVLSPSQSCDYRDFLKQRFNQTLLAYLLASMGGPVIETQLMYFIGFSVFGKGVTISGKRNYCPEASFKWLTYSPSISSPSRSVPTAKGNASLLIGRCRKYQNEVIDSKGKWPQQRGEGAICFLTRHCEMAFVRTNKVLCFTGHLDRISHKLSKLCF